MKTPFRLALVSSLLVAGLTMATRLPAAEVDAQTQQKLDAKIAEIQSWAADPVIVAAVVAHNSELPADQAAMTQEKWKSLSLLDPFVRSFAKNSVGAALKAKKAEWTTEAFVSDAKGFKVGFLAKTTNWCHAGNPKHDQPMAGKTWQGPLTVDESTGLQQVQLSVPVLQDGKPIGSLVVGISPTKL